MAKTDVWMPMYWADLFADTQHLSREDFGSYMLLIGSYWRRGGPLPDDDAQLRRICRCDAAHWEEARKTLVTLFQPKDGFWWHKRIEEELEKARHNRELASQKGKTGAEKRWGKNGCGYAPAMPVPLAGAIPNDSSSPSPSPSPSCTTTLLSDESDANIPTLAEVLTYASMHAVTEQVAKRFFSHYEGKRLWVNQHGHLINWRFMVVDWQTNERKVSPTKPAQGANHRPEGITPKLL